MGKVSSLFHCFLFHRLPPTLLESAELSCICTVCVCVFFPFILRTSSSLDVPAGVTQEEGHTGFLIRLLSAVRALVFLARRIQPFLSVVDREVEYCVLSSPSVGHVCFLFFVFSEKNLVCRDRTHVPTCQKVTWIPLSYRGDRLVFRMYVCMVITYSKSMDQLGKVANPARGQLNRENGNFPVRVRA